MEMDSDLDRITLTPGEIGRLVWERHSFWCNSQHHQSAACLDNMARGVDAKGIAREQAVIEEIVRERIADTLEAVAISPEFRLSGHSGVSVTRLRKAAMLLRSSSGEAS